MKALRSTRPLLTLLASALLACTQAESHADSGARGASTREPQMLSQRGKVNLTTHDGREFQLDVEIASNDQTRARGLMYRKSMPEDAGMIFVFAEQEQHSFWMKNTLIPLDMLFIDASGRVIGVVENAEPLTLTARNVDGLSKYVLEVNGGWCSRHGVGRGDRMALEGMYELK